MVHQDWRDPYLVQLCEKSHEQLLEQFSYSMQSLASSHTYEAITIDDLPRVLRKKCVQKFMTVKIMTNKISTLYTNGEIDKKFSLMKLTHPIR